MKISMIYQNQSISRKQFIFTKSGKIDYEKVNLFSNKFEKYITTIYLNKVPFSTSFEINRFIENFKKFVSNPNNNKFILKTASAQHARGQKVLAKERTNGNLY